MKNINYFSAFTLMLAATCVSFTAAALTTVKKTAITLTS